MELLQVREPSNTRRVLLVIALALAAPMLLGCAGSRGRYDPEANPPDIRAASIIGAVDSLHVSLKDGRTVRLAHVVAPAAGTPAAVDSLTKSRVFWARESREASPRFALKCVGRDADGTELVEPWLYFRPMRCRDGYWLDELFATDKPPAWVAAIGSLLDLGLRISPDDPDPSLHEAQRRWDEYESRRMRSAI